MKTLWQKDKVVWTEGLKKMSLVLKGPKLKNTSAGKSHAHLQPDLKKFFPTKVRFRVIQISEGSPIKSKNQCQYFTIHSVLLTNFQ